jgi:hypothetical protein
MQKEPVEIPQRVIISNSWNEGKIIQFLQGLPKDTIFGYSEVFCFNGIKDLAWRNGVEVKKLPLRSPLRKKFGDYVLKVARPYTPRVEPICADFSLIWFIELKTAPGNRRCRGNKCTSMISKGAQFIEIANLTDLPNGRRGYVRESFCMNCGTAIVKSKVTELLNLIPRPKVTSTLIHLVKEL